MTSCKYLCLHFWVLWVIPPFVVAFPWPWKNFCVVRKICSQNRLWCCVGGAAAVEHHPRLLEAVPVSHGEPWAHIVSQARLGSDLSCSCLHLSRHSRTETWYCTLYVHTLHLLHTVCYIYQTFIQGGYNLWKRVQRGYMTLWAYRPLSVIFIVVCIVTLTVFWMLTSGHLECGRYIFVFRIWGIATTAINEISDQP